MADEFNISSEDLPYAAPPVQINTAEVVLGRLGGNVRLTANSDSVVGSSNWVSDLTSGVTNPPMSFAGVVSEVIVFNRKLSEEERQIVYGYLSRKYALETKMPDAFKTSHNSAYLAGISYWGIQPHPNTNGLDTIPKGAEFSGITLNRFFAMNETVYKSAGTRLSDGTVLGSDTYA